MDVRVKLGNALQPKPVVAKWEDTPKGLLQANSIAYQDGQVAVDGRVLGSNEMDLPISELGVQDGAYIIVNSKQSGGLRLAIR